MSKKKIAASPFELSEGMVESLWASGNPKTVELQLKDNCFMLAGLHFPSINIKINPNMINALISWPIRACSPAERQLKSPKKHSSMDNFYAQKLNAFIQILVSLFPTEKKHENKANDEENLSKMKTTQTGLTGGPSIAE